MGDTNSLVVQLGLDMKNLEAGLNKSNKLLEGFKDSVFDIGKSLVAAFAVERVVGFAGEISKLAGESEGVKHAFDRLKDSQQVLEQMRTATQNTVSDLSLMKYAVQAENFGIPIKNLANLFEFAHQRAVATGQSVDYLVQSIVTGIGRKSPLILDNLGISAIALKEKLKGVGTETATIGDVAQAVGSIASEALSKMGGSIETVSTKMEQNSAKWDNLKVKMGEFINKSGLVNAVLKAMSVGMDILANNGPKDIDVLTQELRIYNQMLAEGKGAKFLENQLNNVMEAAKKANRNLIELSDGAKKMLFIKPEAVTTIDGGDGDDKKEELVKNIAFYEKEIAQLKEEEKQFTGQALSDTQKQIQQEQEKLDLLKKQYEMQVSMSRREANAKKAQALYDTHKTENTPESVLEKIAKASEHAANKNVTLAQSFQNLRKKMDDFASGKGIQKMVTGYEAMQNEFLKRTEFIKSNIQNLNNAINQSIDSVVVNLGTALGELAAGTQSSEQIFAGLLSSVGSIAIQLGQLAIGTGIAILGINTALRSLNPYVAIAAGIALVALGAAVKGAASRMGSSGGGGGGSIAHSYSGGSSSSYRDSSNGMTRVAGSVQIKGQDLWVVLSNYHANSKFTKVGG